MNWLRAELYSSLAEALAPGELPGWLALPGREWPLFACLSGLAVHSTTARCTAAAVARIPGETVGERKARYQALFGGPGEPRFWLYESAHRSGRLLGPETLAVEKFYRNAGLEVDGAELPDHASVELAFLAHLASQEASSPAQERRFIRQHAGRWLPGLGCSLSRTGDPVYAPLGELLAGWLVEAARVGWKRLTPKNGFSSLPVIQSAEKCTLCGFCVQVCPPRALAMVENSMETVLVLTPGGCIRCGKCERICEFQAIELLPEGGVAGYLNGLGASAERIALRRSALSTCRLCGSVIASQAELDYVNRMLGTPSWLETCPACRAKIN